MAYHLQKDDCKNSIDSEKPGHHHHDHGHGQVSPQYADGGDPATVNNRQQQTNSTNSFSSVEHDVIMYCMGTNLILPEKLTGKAL